MAPCPELHLLGECHFFGGCKFVELYLWFNFSFFRNCIQNGVILGADTRATAGSIVCDKNCEKIHYMAPNIYCCGAGTAADTEAVTGTFYFYS